MVITSGPSALTCPWAARRRAPTAVPVGDAGRLHLALASCLEPEAGQRESIPAAGLSAAPWRAPRDAGSQGQAPAPSSVLDSWCLRVWEGEELGSARPLWGQVLPSCHLRCNQWHYLCFSNLRLILYKIGRDRNRSRAIKDLHNKPGFVRSKSMRQTHLNS